MNKVIISINGSNGVGKTTFLKNFTKAYPQYIFFSLKSTKKINDPSWWFVKSTPMELINEIIKIVTERDKKIKTNSNTVILLDKGIITMKARIFSTLKVRGYSKARIEKAMAIWNKKCTNILNEDIAFSILSSNKIGQVPSLNKYNFNLYNKLQKQYLLNHCVDFTIRREELLTIANFEMIYEIIESRR